MGLKFIPAAILLSLVALTGCDIEDFNGAQYKRDFHYNFPLQAGGHLMVESFNGAIEISSWDQPSVDINGTKYAPTEAEADALRIEVDHSPDSVSVRAAKPYQRHGNHGARFTIKIPRGVVLERIVTSNGAIQAQDGAGPALLKTSNAAVRVHAIGGRLEIHTSNGSIELDGVDGDVVAETSNSHIRAQGVSGSLEANSSNGNVTDTAIKSDRPVRINTSNGSVDLILPQNFNAGVRAHTSNSGITLHMAEPVNAQISAHTSNSSISSDFDLRVRGEVGKNQMEGTIGSGGPLIDLSTSNGSIRIVRQPT